MGKNKGKCPVCGEAPRTKVMMAREMLKIAGYPETKSLYGDGNFSYYEMLAVYNYIKSCRKGKCQKRKR